MIAAEAGLWLLGSPPANVAVRCVRIWGLWLLELALVDGISFVWIWDVRESCVGRCLEE
jgi:hypothetical protein